MFYLFFTFDLTQSIFGLSEFQGQLATESYKTQGFPNRQLRKYRQVKFGWETTVTGMYDPMLESLWEINKSTSVFFYRQCGERSRKSVMKPESTGFITDRANSVHDRTVLPDRSTYL